MNSASEFWQYAVALYQAAQVKDSCLTLQDDGGANVNMLLLACYLGQRHQAWDTTILDGLNLAIGHSEQLLQAHRQQRRQAKGQAEVYDILLQQELRLEAQQQQLMLQYLASQTLLPGDEASNLRVYQDYLDCAFDACWRSILAAAQSNRPPNSRCNNEFKDQGRS